jgi:hypothetical protein
MRKPTFSPTKLTTYLTCRIKYYWAYMTPYGKWMRRSHPAFAFGANLHRALEYFHSYSLQPCRCELRRNRRRRRPADCAVQLR